MNNYNLGIDLGYANIKIVWPFGKRTFPTVAGTPEQSAFTLSGKAYVFQIEYEDRTYNIGHSAVDHSRQATRREDRGWLDSETYMVFLHAALSEVQKEGTYEAIIVTGLPVSFYELDKDKIKQRFEGIHHIKRDKNNTFTVNVTKCIVIPQPMGTLANVALNDEGKVADGRIFVGRVGVIDIGGKTTNLLHALKMGDIERETQSLNVGAWDAVRAMRPHIEKMCPDVGYLDHEISDAIVKNHIRYQGKDRDLSEIAKSVLDPIAERIVAKAKELWPGEGARLDTILLAGGGALLLADRIQEQIQHEDIRLVDDAVFSNANGYYKMARFMGEE